MLKYLKKYWLYTLLAPLFMIGEVIMDLLQPKLMSIIVDEGILGLSNNYVGDLNLVIMTGLKMIGLVLIGGLFGILSGVFANLCSQNFGNDIRKDCFKRIMSLSFEQMDKFSTGSLVTRVTNDITQVQNLVAQCIRGFVRTMMLFGGGIVCLLSLDLSFGQIILCALPVVVIGIVVLMARVNPIFKVLQKKLDWVNSVMQENVSGSRVVKAYVREDYEKERFGKANDELVGTQLRVLKLFAYMTPLMNIVLNLVIVALIAVGGIRVQEGDVSPGSVMAAITYVSQIFHSIMMMVNIFQTISRGNASADRLKEVLKSEPTIVDGTFDEKTLVKGKIEFQDVSFAYPNSKGDIILKHINLTIQPGETLGILGATGSGKSSLVNLIPRFYDATEGRILINNVDVKDYKLSDLRDKIAIALQKSELFSTSIKENIAWGKAGATEMEIEKAASIAQAADFIEGKPEGYHTMVAEKGMSLSGGQKQRIAISRAVLKEAEILILDDSTSALDLKTEAKLYEAFRKNYEQVTKIIIAQRIASVKDADRIVVIDNGEIIDCDTHENLLHNSKIYQDIYSSQLKGGGDKNE